MSKQVQAQGQGIPQLQDVPVYYSPCNYGDTNTLRNALMKNPTYAPDKEYHDIVSGEKRIPKQPIIEPRRKLR